MVSKKLFGFGLAIAAFAAYRVWNTQASLSFLQYSINGIKLRWKTLLAPEVIFSINVLNPNRTAVPVQSFFGVIKQNGTDLASFSNTTPINLAGNETQTIDVTARVKAVAFFIAVLQKKINLKQVQIVGMLKTGAFDMPINTTVDVLPGLAGTDDEIEGIKSRTNRIRSRQRPFIYKGFLHQKKYMVPGTTI